MRMLRIKGARSLSIALTLTAGCCTPVAADAAQAAPASATTPCSFASVSACQSTDPSIKTYVVFSGDTSGCVFNISINWADASAVQHVQFSSPADGTLFLASHSYPYQDKQKTYTIRISGTVTAGSCTFTDGTLTFTLLTCTNAELSGPSWATKFPDATLVSKLAAPFRGDVTRFIAAMTRAGISERTIATLRPVERAYLMHYSWLVATGALSPVQVPHFAASPGHPPVGICWVHTDAAGVDRKASVAAARGLASALGIPATLTTAPLLVSSRTKGLEIVMSTTWSKTSITITDGHGRSVTIRTDPHNGLNAKLIAVGATYGVIHFVTARAAPKFWSSTGH